MQNVMLYSNVIQLEGTSFLKKKVVMGCLAEAPTYRPTFVLFPNKQPSALEFVKNIPCSFFFSNPAL